MMTAAPRIAKDAAITLFPTKVAAMSNVALAATIEAAWENRAAIGASTGGEVRDAVEEAL